jgi:hypothetical protein
MVRGEERTPDLARVTTRRQAMWESRTGWVEIGSDGLLNSWHGCLEHVPHD